MKYHWNNVDHYIYCDQGVIARGGTGRTTTAQSPPLLVATPAKSGQGPGTLSYLQTTAETPLATQVFGATLLTDRDGKDAMFLSAQAQKL